MNRERLGDHLEIAFDEIGAKYPETIKKFIDIQDDMLILFCKKQADYGPSNIGMGKSVLDTDEDVKRSLLGLSVRLNDKVQRLLNLTLNDKDPNNESVEDTLIDIANYAVMSILCMKKVWGR